MRTWSPAIHRLRIGRRVGAADAVPQRRLPLRRPRSAFPISPPAGRLRQVLRPLLRHRCDSSPDRRRRINHAITTNGRVSSLIVHFAIEIAARKGNWMTFQSASNTIESPERITPAAIAAATRIRPPPREKWSLKSAASAAPSRPPLPAIGRRPSAGARARVRAQGGEGDTPANDAERLVGLTSSRKESEINEHSRKQQVIGTKAHCREGCVREERSRGTADVGHLLANRIDQIAGRIGGIEADQAQAGEDDRREEPQRRQVQSHPSEIDHHPAAGRGLRPKARPVTPSGDASCGASCFASTRGATGAIMRPAKT